MEGVIEHIYRRQEKGMIRGDDGLQLPFRAKPLATGNGKDVEMKKFTEARLINPNTLSELAQEALQEASNIKNPYLSALMSRFGMIALKLRATLERETRH